MSAGAPRAGAPAASGTGGNPWVIAGLVALASFMEVLDSTIANVVLPYIAGGMGVSQDEASWVVTTYLVANAVSLTASPFLARRLGRKTFFLVCLALFTGSSLLCANAWNLQVGPEVCQDVQSGLNHEWLVTNGLGGYASGSIEGATTRCYHGLLVAALRPPVERTGEGVILPRSVGLRRDVCESRWMRWGAIMRPDRSCSNACLSTTRCTFSIRPGPPAFPSASCTARAPHCCST